MRNFRRHTTLGLALLAAFAGAAPAKAGNTKSPGKSLFESNCVLCHGDDGMGKTPAGAALGAHNLASAEVSKKSDGELAETITQGRNKMPSFGKKLSDADIHELISYIRELQKKKN
jgi:mono/diheme cytochrome c family protein